VDDAKDTAEDGQIELENANEEASDTLNEKAEGRIFGCRLSLVGIPFDIGDIVFNLLSRAISSALTLIGGVEEQKKAIEGASGDVTDKVGGAKDDLEDQYEDAQDASPSSSTISPSSLRV
jgi:hypothetical protein